MASVDTFSLAFCVPCFCYFHVSVHRLPRDSAAVCLPAASSYTASCSVAHLCRLLYVWLVWCRCHKLHLPMLGSLSAAFAAFAPPHPIRVHHSRAAPSPQPRVLPDRHSKRRSQSARAYTTPPSARLQRGSPRNLARQFPLMENAYRSLFISTQAFLQETANQGAAAAVTAGARALDGRHPRPPEHQAPRQLHSRLPAPVLGPPPPLALIPAVEGLWAPQDNLATVTGANEGQSA